MEEVFVSPSIEEIIEAIENDENLEDGGLRNQQKLPWEICSSEYIHFAQQDIVDPSRRGIVNALGNAKRALECQLDSLIIAVGIPKQKNVPSKIKILNDAGIIAPNILSKINKHRNEVEHEYICPEYERVTDFVDVVFLFIEATRYYIEDRYCEWTVVINNNCVKISLSSDGLSLSNARNHLGKPYAYLKGGVSEQLKLLAALFAKRFQ